MDAYLQERDWEPYNDISAEQTAFATALRIPLLATSQPHWSYITGVVVGTGEFPDNGIVPTDAEIRVIADRLEEYCSRWYRTSFRAAMKRRGPFDIDGAANLGYFLKRPSGSWVYRKRTWDRGPYWAPNNELLSLHEVIGRMRR